MESLDEDDVEELIRDQDWNGVVQILSSNCNSTSMYRISGELMRKVANSKVILEDAIEFCVVLSTYVLNHQLKGTDSALIAKVEFFDQTLKFLSSSINTKKSELAQYKLLKPRNKSLPLVSTYKIEEKLKSSQEFIAQFKNEYESVFSQANTQELNFFQSAERLYEDSNELNERMLSLNEEVILRLDCYLQTQSQMLYYFKKALEEQETSLKNTETVLATAQNELNQNLASLTNAQNKNSKRLLNLFYYFFTFCIIGFVLTSTLLKRTGLLPSSRLYY